MAKVRAYYYDGSLAASNIDDQRNASHAGINVHAQYDLVDGTIYGNHTFEMKVNQTLEIPVEISNFDSGLNDVLFVIVKNSNITSLDNEYRASTDMNHLLFIRFNVANDNDLSPKYNITKFKAKNSNILDGVFISKTEDNLQRWLSEKTSPEKSINYFIDVGNVRSDAQSYALITLFDWKQIKIDGKNDVLFFQLDKNKQTTIPAAFRTPSKPNIYDLTSILIYNPYTKLDMYNRTVETPIRVGINVVK